MNRNYDRALQECLKSEGGFTNEKTDPGGPTNFGITIYDAGMYLNPGLSKKPPWTTADLHYMKNLQLEQAKEIYQAKYWDKLRCDELPDGVDYSAFDFGVNSGVIRSAKLLQKFVGVEADGIIGPASVKAVQNYQDKIFLITEFNNRRLAYLKGLHHWKTYGRGWTTRVNKVKAISLDMLGTPA